MQHTFEKTLLNVEQVNLFACVTLTKNALKLDSNALGRRAFLFWCMTIIRYYNTTKIIWRPAFAGKAGLESTTGNKHKTLIT